jgi:hypothetical protein
MSPQHSVLLLGGTGRTGTYVLKHLLDRGITVRAIVRSTRKLPPAITENSHLTVIETDLLSLSGEDLQRHVRGCDAVISCLGHVISLKGIYGPPRDFVTLITKRIAIAIEGLKPASPIKFILMNSVSVNHPAEIEMRRGAFERLFLLLLRGLLPPARDNQEAVNFLFGRNGTAHSFMEWTAIRPDTLIDGDVSDYVLHDSLVNSLFAPGTSTMANIAHFVCELVVRPETWTRWKGKLPVLVNAAGTSGGSR